MPAFLSTTATAAFRLIDSHFVAFFACHCCIIILRNLRLSARRSVRQATAYYHGIPLPSFDE
jgi:hypothetical protein